MMEHSIALLTDGIPPYVTGGMQRHSLELCRQLLLQGFNVQLIHCVPADMPIPSETDVHKMILGNEEYTGRLSVKGYHFPSPGILPGHYIRNSLKYSKTICESISDQTSDLIYAQGFTAWHYLLQKKRTIPVWVNFHGLNMFQPTIGVRARLKSIMLRKAVRKNLLKADKVISLGGHLSEILWRNVGVQKSGILVEPNGIKASWILERYQDDGQNKKRKFLFVGRNDKIKQFDLFYQLAKENSDAADFGFVGPFQKVNEKGITFFGAITKDEELKLIYDDYNVIVCTSISEGLPTTLLEGMARGMVVLTTPVGVATELVNGNGVITEGFDAVAIREGINQILSMTESEFSDARKLSLERVRSYSWDSIGAKVANDIISFFLKKIE